MQTSAGWLAAALADAGRISEADQLSTELQPAGLQASLGGHGWPARLDALRARIMIRLGREQEGRTLLSTALSQLEKDGAPAWMIESLRQDRARSRL